MADVIESKPGVSVSDDVIREAVLSWLPSVDFTTITRRVCTAEIEKLHGWDLSDKKDVIKEALSEFVENETKKALEIENTEKKKRTNSGEYFVIAIMDICNNDNYCMKMCQYRIYKACSIILGIS